MFQSNFNPVNWPDRLWEEEKDGENGRRRGRRCYQDSTQVRAMVILLEEISCSLIEPALDGEEEEDMFDDIQGDLAGLENDLARNPR